MLRLLGALRYPAETPADLGSKPGSATPPSRPRLVLKTGFPIRDCYQDDSACVSSAWLEAAGTINVSSLPDPKPDERLLLFLQRLLPPGAAQATGGANCGALGRS